MPASEIALNEQGCRGQTKSGMQSIIDSVQQLISVETAWLFVYKWGMKTQGWKHHIDCWLQYEALFMKVSDLGYLPISILNSILNSMLINKNFQTWFLIGCQHSRQSMRSHVRKSTLTKCVLIGIFLVIHALDRATANGPLNIYVKLWVAHALGMAGTFSLSQTSKETAS